MTASSPCILIVEDDDFKRGEIARVISDLVHGYISVTASSVQAAVAALRSREFDCVVLDISLPSHDPRKGESSPTSMPSGGLEVLMELAFLKRTDPVLVVTQYPEVEIDGSFVPLARLSRRVSEVLQVKLSGVILFDKDSDEWRGRLRTAVEECID